MRIGASLICGVMRHNARTEVLMSSCSECGGDTSRISTTVVAFKCKCGEDVRVRPSSVNPETGASVIHETMESAMAGMLLRMSSFSDDSGSVHTPKNCQYTSLVPPDAFCPRCKKNFRPGWESLVVSGNSEDLEEARLRYNPIVRQYRSMARKYISKYGPLQRVEYLSHFPTFEIQFVFGRKIIYSGARRSGYDIHPPQPRLSR
jgi:hypothetical protein